MNTRQERADQVLELSQGRELLAWALALNDVPLRRSYFVAVTGFEDDVVVKVLARLANAGLLATTEGLTFALADTSMAPLLMGGLSQETRKALHEKSLEQDPEGGLPDSFHARHALGAGLHETAARLMLKMMHSAQPANPESLAGPMNVAFQSLIKEGTAEGGFLEELGFAVLDLGVEHLKPRAFKVALKGIRGLSLDKEALARVAAIEKARKAARELAKVQDVPVVAGDSEILTAEDGNREVAVTVDAPEPPEGS